MNGEPAQTADPPSEVAEAPRFRPARRVVVFGRSLPKADTIERAMWIVLMLCCFGALYLAGVVLSPDNRGIGTHEQLGLPACGFVEIAGGPCPSCGFTTTFTLAAHFRPIDAIVNQPFGAFLFVLTVLGAIGLPVVCVKGISLFALTDPWPWMRIGGILLGAWLICWGYKWQAVAL
jgi:hypothetical protein